MDRRAFWMGVPAALMWPARPARAYAPIPYSPQTWDTVAARGGRVVVHFRASWSLTCDAKRETLAALLARAPRFAALTFVEVDWDTFGRSQWAERLDVQRNSTLVALRDGEEVSRIVAQPDARLMRRFLDAALLA